MNNGGLNNSYMKTKQLINVVVSTLLNTPK